MANKDLYIKEEVRGEGEGKERRAERGRAPNV